MDKRLWAKRVADKLVTSEKKLDDAVQAVFELVAEINTAAGDMNVSAAHTNQSLVKVMETASRLQDARTSLISGHLRLDKLGKELDIRPTGIGYQSPTALAPSGDAEIDAERAVG